MFLISLFFHRPYLSLHVEHSVDSRSDHDPLFLKLSIPLSFAKCTTNTFFTRKTASHKANEEHIFSYRCTLQKNLQSVVLPADALLSHDVLCCCSVNMLMTLRMHVCQLLRLMFRRQATECRQYSTPCFKKSSPL